MKSRRLTCITAMVLFAALAICIPLGGQEQTTHFRHYKLIDIGTFGGPNSYINSPSNSFPSLNSRGITVGQSATSVPAPANTNPFGCLGRDGDVPFIFHGFELKNGLVTDLGALSPKDQNCSNAQAVNASGEIAGVSENGVFDPVVGFIEIRAVRWKNGSIRSLGTLGGSQSFALGINNGGQVVGAALNDIADPFSIFDFLVFLSSSGTQTRAFLWQKGSMRDLGTLGGPDAFASFINQRGLVAGFSYTSFTPNDSGFPTVDPFIWDNGRMIDVGTLGGTFGQPLALNNSGQVIGFSNLAGDQAADPFLWNKGKLIDLNTETIGGSPESANALNEAGEIVGTAAFSGRPFDAYVWRKGVATDLGVLEGDCFSEAFAINSRDQIVGFSAPCALNFQRAFLWEKGSMVDLNAVASPNSLRLIDVESINDRGEIAGLGVPLGCSDFPDDGTCGHAYLLIPVCEDGSEGCTDAPLDPAVVAQSRPASGAAPKRMTAEELAMVKERVAKMHARMAGRNRGFGLWPRR